MTLPVSKGWLTTVELSVCLSPMTYSCDKYRFPLFINFINDPILAYSDAVKSPVSMELPDTCWERIATEGINCRSDSLLKVSRKRAEFVSC